jgi:hypothetical protein
MLYLSATMNGAAKRPFKLAPVSVEGGLKGQRTYDSDVTI